MCGVSTIICATHPDVDLPLDFVQIYSKSKKGRGAYNLLEEYICNMYSFSNSFCTRVIDSEHFIDRLWYRKGYDIHYEREVMFEDVATPPQERLETPTTSMPTGFQLPTRPSPSAVRWRWVVYAGVWLKTVEAVGPTRWDRVAHAGVGLNTCVGLYTMAFGSKWRCWALTLAFGSKRRYWIIRAGVGPYIMALGCTRRCFLCRA